MRVKIVLGLAVATLLAVGLLAGSSLCILSPAEAQQPPPEAPQLIPPPPVPVPRTGLQPPPEVVPAPFAPLEAGPARPLATPVEPLLVRFTTSVAPIFEGGAVGMPLPVTIEIRGDERLTKIIRLAAWRRKLPDKVKEALQVALEEAATDASPEDPRLDEILERLERMEQRLKQIEEQKSSKSP